MMLEDVEEYDNDWNHFGFIGSAGEVGWGVTDVTLSSTAPESDQD